MSGSGSEGAAGQVLEHRQEAGGGGPSRGPRSNASSRGGAGPHPTLSLRLLEAAMPRVAAVLCTGRPGVKAGEDDAG